MGISHARGCVFLHGSSQGNDQGLMGSAQKLFPRDVQVSTMTSLLLPLVRKWKASGSLGYKVSLVSRSGSKRITICMCWAFEAWTSAGYGSHSVQHVLDCCVRVRHRIFPVLAGCVGDGRCSVAPAGVPAKLTATWYSAPPMCNLSWHLPASLARPTTSISCRHCHSLETSCFILA